MKNYYLIVLCGMVSGCHTDRFESLAPKTENSIEIASRKKNVIDKSYASVQINAPYAVLENEIDNKILQMMPGRVYSDEYVLDDVTSKLTVSGPVEVQTKVTDWVEKHIVEKIPIIGGILSDAVSTVEKTILVPVEKIVVSVVSKVYDTVLPTKVKVDYNLFYVNTKVQMKARTITVSSTVNMDARVRLIAATGIAPNTAVKTDMVSCGRGETKPQARLDISYDVAWGPDGILNLSNQKYNLVWINECKLSVFDVKLSSIIDKSGLQKNIDKALNSALAKIPKQMDLEKQFSDQISAINRPFTLGKTGMLLPNINKINISQPYGTDNSIGVNLNVIAQPTFAYRGTPVGPVKRPIITHDSLSGSAFELGLLCQSKQTTVDSMLSLIPEIKIRYKWFEVLKVDKVFLYGSRGGRLIIGVTLKRPFIGTIYVFAKPVFDSTSDRVVFSQLDYAVESKALLAHMDPFFHAPLLRKISQKAYYKLPQKSVDAMNKMMDLKFPITTGTTFGVKTDLVKLEDIYVENKVLKAEIALHGKTKLFVN